MRVLKCDCSKGLNDNCIQAAMSAAEDIAAGNLIVYPTDTVYGIGADIYNEVAVKNLYLAKRRPFDMALSVAVADRKMMESVAILNETADKLIKAFLPGPLTAGSQKVGSRIPDHPIALEIARRSGPIVATSANIHFQPDAIDIGMATAALGNSVSTYIDAGHSPSGKPSTIIWIKDKEYEIIRQGPITEDMIKEVLQC